MRSCFNSESPRIVQAGERGVTQCISPPCPDTRGIYIYARNHSIFVFPACQNLKFQNPASSPSCDFWTFVVKTNKQWILLIFHIWLYHNILRSFLKLFRYLSLLFDTCYIHRIDRMGFLMWLCFCVRSMLAPPNLLLPSLPPGGLPTSNLFLWKVTCFALHAVHIVTWKAPNLVCIEQFTQIKERTPQF